MGQVLTSSRPGTITVSGGSGSVNITSQNSVLSQIFVKAPVSTTTFDVGLTDIHDNVTFKREDETGELNEMLSMACYGNWTLSVSNASADGDFTYCLAFREQ